MAGYLRKIAAGDFDQSEWNDVMVNHYQDIPTESARVRAVELCLGHAEVPEDKIGEYLSNLADSLEQPVEERSFYYRGAAVGEFSELPSEDGEVGYEPYRCGSHHAMRSALRNGEQPICEFMHEGRRVSFKVVAGPSYGRLKIEMNR